MCIRDRLYTVLKYVGAAYLLYLAWKIANSGGMEDGAVSGKPMTFLQAAAFQWVNPKAWVMAVGVIATYTPQAGFFANLVIATVVCGIVNLPSIGVWVTFGTAPVSYTHLDVYKRQPRACRCSWCRCMRRCWPGRCWARRRSCSMPTAS